MECFYLLVRLVLNTMILEVTGWSNNLKD